MRAMTKRLFITSFVFVSIASGCLVSLDGYELAADERDAGGGGVGDGRAGASGDSGGAGGAGGVPELDSGATDGAAGSGGEGGASGAGGTGGSAGSGGDAGFEGGDCGGLDCDLMVPPESEPECKTISANCGSGLVCRIATPAGGRCGPVDPPGCSTAGNSCSAALDCCGARTCFRGQCTGMCNVGGLGCSPNECLYVGHNEVGVCWPPM